MRTILLLLLAGIFLVKICKTNGECFEKMKDWKAVEVNEALLNAPIEYYFPLLSDLDIKRKSAALLGKKSDEIDEARYKNACIRIAYKGQDVNMKGYGGKSVSYKMTKNGTDTITWKRKLESGGEEGGYGKFTMSDKRTYAVIPLCTMDDKFCWCVASLVPELSAETIEAIYKHIESLGGNRKESKKIKYDSCNKLLGVGLI